MPKDFFKPQATPTAASDGAVPDTQPTTKGADPLAPK